MRPVRVLLGVIAVWLTVFAGVTDSAASFTKQELTLVSADGTQLAASLYLPDGTPPSGGWPGVIFMHGLGGTRASVNTIAEAMGVVGPNYAVLSYDARGHGASGGLVGIDGPAEIEDVKRAFAFLRDRPEVADGKIGAWGISYGGGAAWNSLVAGVPWAAIEVVETWTDLEEALAPQGLAKTGVIAGFLSSIDPARISPEVLAIRTAAFAGTLNGVSSFAAARSSITKLAGVKTPVFLMQGRRDFAFGLEQARRAYALLEGPKRLWIGNHGHAPSTFPGADSTAMLTEGKLWFDRHLRGVQVGLDDARPVIVAAEGKSLVSRFAVLPPVQTLRIKLSGKNAITPTGKVQRRTTPTRSVLEVFGAPRVKVTVTAAGGWSRIVAVLSAVTPGGREIVVAGGGTTTRAGKRTLTIRLSDQATVVPRGSRLVLTLASSSLAQNPGNLLYLDLPMPAAARATIGDATLTLPALARPVGT